MPNPNAVVAFVERLDPPLEQVSAAELLRRHPEGIAVRLEGVPGAAARLFPGGAAAGMFEILERLRRLRTPVYLELRPGDRGITRLLIPLVSRVRKVEERGDVVQVELESSHARHALRRDSPEFAELSRVLREAADARTLLAVTETDDHAVIDARPWPYPPYRPEPAPSEVRPVFWWLRGWWRWLVRWWCCVTPVRAQQLFDLCSARTCDPLTVPPPCIPFLYPDDGCWARAHEMCRLMIADGAWPRKVWIDGSLHTPTRNNPYCYVEWGWHVAPTLCVRKGFWYRETMVIDPSLFTTPVSEPTWKSVQGDPNATLTHTPASNYWRSHMPTDPGYVDTNYWLDYFRVDLMNRSLSSAGPPPYAYCP